MISTTMKACQEYTSFVLDPSNRNISDAHVDKLEEAITDVYLLDAYPIVTTAERVIVDGQHRFRLAKSLGIPFYYIAGDDITVEDISMANANTERYRLEDAVHVYSRLGIEPYQFFETFSRRYRCLPTGYLASKLSTQYNSGDFVTGCYTVNRINYANDVLSKLMDFSKYKKEILSWPAYRRAIETLSLSSMYDHDRMMDRLSVNTKRVVHCGRADEVLSLLTDEIYNFNKRSDKRVDLRVACQYQKVIREDTTIENTIELPKRGIVSSSSIHVFEESDLSKFRVHSSCRPARNLNKLADEIKKRNLLRFYPIIVDRDLVVYDGQRRLEAAKKLNVPIYYIVLQNVSMWMIARAGGLTKSWALLDYLKHHASLGVPTYTRVSELMKKHAFLSSESVLAFGSTSSGNEIVRTKFKSGIFEIDDIFMELITFFARLPMSLAKKTKLQRLISSLYRKHQTAYFLKRTQNILVANESVFLPDFYTKALAIKFVDLYNGGLSMENRIEYLSD